MRIFVAFDITPEIRARISAFLDAMRRYAPDAKWVTPESLHVTLKFLGEQPRERVQEIQRALAAVPGQALEITFRNCGFFPTTNRSARVFWIGVEAGEPLRALARDVDEAVSHFGLEREKDYRPHLTLARARPEPRGAERSPVAKWRSSGQQFLQLQSELADSPAPQFGTMTAREFFLYESQLSPKGARYSKIAGFSLAG
jgi:2'-5' RNA ligase